MRKLGGNESKKLFPKLRMIMNGSARVNAMRAELDPAVCVVDEVLLDAACRREPKDRPRTISDRSRERGHIRAPADSVHVNVFIELAHGSKVADLPAGVEVRPALQQSNLLIANVSLAKLEELAKSAAVQRVDPGQAIKFSPPVPEGAADRPSLTERQFGDGRAHQYGRGVVIGIIDVQGFDFSHSDFLDSQGSTRFTHIWDQGGSSRPNPSSFDYGSEITQAHMNAAIEASRDTTNPNRAAPYLLEPQSQLSLSSHGTHVASIAAGNRGICRQANIAAVLISLPNEDTDRRRSFYDSTRISDAVEYLLAIGTSVGLPVSINISLGTNGHAHDASSVVSRSLDFSLTEQGRCISVAAGNAGQEAPTGPGDSGFIMGRIHTSGHLPKAGLTQNVDWIVVGDGIADISENEFELWYSSQDRFAVELIAPDGISSGIVAPSEYIENRLLSNGTVISIYNDVYSSVNGDNHIAIYLSPFFGEDEVIGVHGGTWTVRIHSIEVRDGRYHAWIERDDPRRIGKIGVREAWSFPSFFSARSNVDDSSISSLACGQRIVSVANLDAHRESINISSSQGPTRDGRQKPEICAPGTEIAAANGFSPNEQWASKTGTSMSSPFVAGVAGLMLAIEPRLTAAQIIGIIRRTARPIPGHDFHWRNDTGYGRIDPDACFEEAVAAFTTWDRTE